MAPDDEPDRCLRCGRCCHEKIRVDGRVVITDIPCPFLDAATNLCREYADRFERQPHCATAAKSAAAGGMPGDCPYARDLPGYAAPAMLADRPEYLPLVAEHFPGRSPLAEAWARAAAAPGPSPAAPGAPREAPTRAPAGAGLTSRTPKRPGR